MKKNHYRNMARFESIVICFLIIVILVILAKNHNNEETIHQTEMNTEEIESLAETVTEEIMTNTQEETTQSTEVQVQDDNVNIVVFGDSIWDDFRGDNGLSERIASQTGFNIYNCAIGGTSATITEGSTDVSVEWKSQSLNTMVYILEGAVSADSQLEGLPAKDVVNSVDFSKTDYFILSYGLNDYFMHADPTTDDYYNMDTYEGALRHSIMKIQGKYPDAKILVISPTYCKVLTRDGQPSDSDNCDYGHGVMRDYVEAAKDVANEMNVYFLNAYDDFGMNASNADVNLRDGVHLTDQGMATYAQNVADFLLEVEGL